MFRNINWEKAFLMGAVLSLGYDIVDQVYSINYESDLIKDLATCVVFAISCGLVSFYCYRIIRSNIGVEYPKITIPKQNHETVYHAN